MPPAATIFALEMPGDKLIRVCRRLVGGGGKQMSNYRLLSILPAYGQGWSGIAPGFTPRRIAITMPFQECLGNGPELERTQA
jgi:hypothetical protein